MKKLLFPMALGALSISGAAAQSVFEGTWKVVVINYLTKAPEEYLVQDGISDCKTCDPPIALRADGMFHPITNNPHYDSGSYEVLDDHHAKATNKKNGTVVQTVDIAVSDDGNTLTQSWVVRAEKDGSTLRSGTNILKRVTKGPPGSHLISGSWRWEKMENISDSETLWTYKVSGDQLTMTAPTGQSFAAKFDGTEAPVKGDPDTTSVRLKLVGSDTLEETDLHDGKIISVSRMTVAADGKTAKIVGEDKRDNTTSSFEAVKQ